MTIADELRQLLERERDRAAIGSKPDAYFSERLLDLLVRLAESVEPTTGKEPSDG